MFWKFHTWSEPLASKLQAKTYFQELLSGAAQIINICLCLWKARKLISLLVSFTAHYLGKRPQKSFLEFLLSSLWLVHGRYWSGWICSCGQGSLVLNKFLHVLGSVFWLGITCSKGQQELQGAWEWRCCSSVLRVPVRTQCCSVLVETMCYIALCYFNILTGR